MRKEFEPLFTPWKIRNVEIKNRIVMTSMGGTSIFGWMEPLHFDKEAANFLLDKAKNNVGLILPGIAPIKNVMFGGWLYKKKHLFKKVKVFMDEIHKYGSKMFIQLTAGFGRSFAASHLLELLGSNKFLGFLMKPVLNVDYLTRSASPNPNRWSDKLTSKELTPKQIDQMVEAFAKTALLCKEANVDGVEIHAVHEGYLLDQFTMKYTNQRTDEYGGSLENRYRFPIRIVKAIKELCGEDYPVSLRYSVVSKTKGFRMGALPGEEYVEVGRDFEESIQAVKLLEEAGYDMLNCDNGTYDAWYWSHPPGYMPKNCNLEDVENIKKYTKLPVVAAGKMEMDAATKSVKEGKIDGVGVARQFLADTQWVTKLIDDRLSDIRPCICCHNACFTLAHYEGVGNDQPLSDTIHMARCAINPETMQSKKYKIVKTDNPKQIAVIGGGIGGMEVARVATLRGHDVTIYEKTDKLGGVFIDATKMSFKDKEAELLEWFVKQINDLNIKVELNHEVTDVSSLGADEIIIATGAKPRKLNTVGIDKTIEAIEYLKGAEVGKDVLVIGGGLTGCEIAYDLHLKGKNPIIVEMKNDLIAVPGVCLANSSYLREYFALHKIPVYLESFVKEIKDGEVIITGIDPDDVKSIKVDSVIRSVGYIPTPIPTQAKNTHIIGDASKVGNLRNVIWQAWDVAMKL